MKQNYMKDMKIDDKCLRHEQKSRMPLSIIKHACGIIYLPVTSTWKKYSTSNRRVSLRWPARRGTFSWNLELHRSQQ